MIFLGFGISSCLVVDFIRETSLRDGIHKSYANYNIKRYVKNIFDEIII